MSCCLRYYSLLSNLSRRYQINLGVYWRQRNCCPTQSASGKPGLQQVTDSFFPARFNHSGSMSPMQRDQSQLLEKDAHKIQEQIYKLKAKRSRHEDRANTISVINLLLDDGVNQSNIVKFFSKNEKLLLHPFPRWQEVQQHLRSYGFSNMDTLSVMTNVHEIWAGDFSIISETISALRALGFNQNDTNELITSNPHIVDLSRNSINERFTRMLHLFDRNRAKRTLVKCPNCFTDDWDDIQDKYVYVLENMGFDEREMAKTNLLTHSIDHIRSRHLFLVRAGLFKAPKKGVTFKETGNDALKDIQDTSDEFFATRVAGLTHVEYRIFKKLLLEENAYDGLLTGDMAASEYGDDVSDDEEEY